MILLLDTHLLLWAAAIPEKLSANARQMINDDSNTLWFSAASLWEIAIKRGLERPDFQVNPAQLRRGLLDNGYQELAVSGLHALAMEHLPPIHKDPFDRMLVAQAATEGVLLLTADEKVAAYGGAVLLV